MSITYRMLPQAEWSKLEPLYFELFPESPLPPPELASVAVAEDNGNIVGFWFLQTCAHMEPAGLKPEYCDSVSMHSLRNELHNAFSYMPGLVYHLTAVNSKLEEALSSAGFQAIGTSMIGCIPTTE